MHRPCCPAGLGQTLTATGTLHRVLLVSRQRKAHHSDVTRFAHQMAALRYVSSILAERDVHEAAVQAQARGPRGQLAGTKEVHEM